MILETIFAIGTAFELGAEIFGANAEAEAAERDAENKRLQAHEVIRRVGVQKRLMEEQAIRFVGSQHAAYARGGGRVVGTTLSEMETSWSAAVAEINEMINDGNFRAAQLWRGADIGMDVARDRRTAGVLGAAGSLTRGARRIYGVVADKNSGKTETFSDALGSEF